MEEWREVGAGAGAGTGLSIVPRRKISQFPEKNNIQGKTRAPLIRRFFKVHGDLKSLKN